MECGILVLHCYVLKRDYLQYCTEETSADEGKQTVHLMYLRV